MNKLMQFIVSFVMIMMIVQPAFAGDFAKSGTVLKEDSYVFSIEEAEDLMQKYSFFEKEYDKHILLIEEYKKLDLIQQNQKHNLDDLLEIKDLQIAEYQKIKSLDQQRIDQLNKQARSNKFERWGFFAVGVGITVGAIILADKIDDGLEKTNTSNTALLKF